MGLIPRRRKTLFTAVKKWIWETKRDLLLWLVRGGRKTLLKEEGKYHFIARGGYQRGKKRGVIFSNYKKTATPCERGGGFIVTARGKRNEGVKKKWSVKKKKDCPGPHRPGKGILSVDFGKRSDYQRGKKREPSASASGYYIATDRKKRKAKLYR